MSSAVPAADDLVPSAVYEAWTVPERELYRELYRSMIVISLEHRLIGSFGIVGGSIAAATGAALALRRTGNVAVAFFGDGATNQAYFFECFNFAALYELPIVFVCENNLYSEYSRTSDLSRGDIQERAVSLGVPGQRIDGMSVWVVREAALRAAQAARG